MSAAVDEFPYIDWNVKPKFSLLPGVIDTIQELGNVEMVSTEFGERSHADVKAAYHFSNCHPARMLEQVCSSGLQSHTLTLSLAGQGIPVRHVTCLEHRPANSCVEHVLHVSQLTLLEIW